MTMKTLLAAAAIALATTGPVMAAPIELDFTFDGVSGTFFGLDDADGFSAATSYNFNGLVDVYTNVDASSADANVFSFANGELASVDFNDAPTSVGSGADGLLISLIVGPTLMSIEQHVSNGELIFAMPPDPLVAFTQRSVAEAPLPTSVWLLLSALAAVVGAKRWKKQTA